MRSPDIIWDIHNIWIHRMVGQRSYSYNYCIRSYFNGFIPEKKSEINIGQVIVEGLDLGAYKFNKYKESKDEKTKLRSIKILSIIKTISGGLKIYY